MRAPGTEPGTKQELLPVLTTPLPLLSALPTQRAAGPQPPPLPPAPPCLRGTKTPPHPRLAPWYALCWESWQGLGEGSAEGRGRRTRCFSKVLSNYQFWGPFSFKSQISLPLPFPFQRTTPPSLLASLGFFHPLSGLPLPLCTDEEMPSRFVQGLKGLRGLGRPAGPHRQQKTDPESCPTTMWFFPLGPWGEGCPDFTLQNSPGSQPSGLENVQAWGLLGSAASPGHARLWWGWESCHCV